MSTSKYAKLVIEKIEEGIYDAKYIVECFTRFCSDDDIYDMLQNEYLLQMQCIKCGEEDELNEQELCENCLLEREEDDEKDD